MKKNYLELYGNNTTEARQAVHSDLKIELEQCPVKSTSYGNGIITEVISEVADNNGTPDFKVNIDFENNKNKQFYFNVAITRGSLQVDEDKVNSIKIAIDEISAIFEKMKEDWKIQEALREEECRKAKEEKARLEEEKAKQAKIKKQIERLETNKANQIKNANLLEKTKISKVNNDFYYALGWLAKHSKKITAAMPDYLDKWFTNIFGNVEHRSVDQSVLSPSGLPSQFALYMKIDLDTNDNIPTYLTNHLGDVSKDIKPISDTPFVFDLVRDYGFKFGKTQNITEIEDNIPTENLDDFRLGYSA